MSINKNALLRYRVLDKCFRNFSKKYYLSDLLDKVNDALLNENANSLGIKLRQLREDIRFMKSESGYSAPIEMYREGKKGFYRYTDKHFAIDKSPLNSTEVEKLKSALGILQRLGGKPEFEWLNEIAPLLQDQLRLVKSDNSIMSYDSNIDYSGYHLISTAFEAIINKVVLNVVYQPFKGDSFEIIFHPYYLKQYNNRWFLLGYNEETKIETWNLPLDRIKGVQETDKAYRETVIDWDDYFYDIIGVTKLSGELDQIELSFTADQAPYISTKPLHSSQKSYLNKDGSLLVKLELIINYEFETLLLSFGEKVKVLKPSSLQDSIRTRLKKGFSQYK